MIDDARPVIATRMTMIGLTIRAATAAWPRMIAPTMPIVEPRMPGMRTPASRMSSKDTSITKTSNQAGKGTSSRAAAIASASSVGSAS